MNDELTKTYYVRTVNATLYFNVRGGTVCFDGKATRLSEQKLHDFLAIAREMGMVTGEVGR